MQLRTLAALLVIGALIGSSAGAQTATQTVTFQVDAINQVAVTGTPSLSVNTATAGSAPTAASYSTGTWAITTNQTGSKVTGSIGVAMPTGVTLSANLSTPSGGTSAGAVSLGTVAADLVTGITKLNAASLGLTYTLNATAAAGVVASTTRTVTFTVTGGI